MGCCSRASRPPARPRARPQPLSQPGRGRRGAPVAGAAGRRGREAAPAPRHRVYRLVEDTKHGPRGGLELILTRSVEGKARHTLLPRLAAQLLSPFLCIREAAAVRGTVVAPLPSRVEQGPRMQRRQERCAGRGRPKGAGHSHGSPGGNGSSLQRELEVS